MPNQYKEETMNKRALILTVMALGLATMLSGAPGLAQTVQQPKATPPPAEKAAVPAPQAEKATAPEPDPHRFCKRCVIS